MPGATPFIGNVAATYAAGSLQSVSYQILPKTGSLTRPLTASYSAQYLTSTGALQSGSVTVPVFGLYAGYTNTVSISFNFTDGSQSVQQVSIVTAPYTEPCTNLTSGTLTQNRASTSDLGFDFFILKDICSTNDPAIIDTDGNFRWVGQANDGTSAVALYNNAIYLSDGKTGILRIDLTNDAVTKIGDYAAAPYNVTYTGHHNIDPGRDGLIVDVNTATQTEAANLEFNPNTGTVLNFWDLGQILSYTMTKGGDNPAGFVLGTSADWFHNNATAYNPADNTLIVSSRENFVVAVDYDTPADGQKKIHWILGDTSKAWYQYPSLRAFMLSPTNTATLAPIGQHAVSIDHNGLLLLFDDGFQSATQQPAGISRTYSAVREYKINAAALTATAGSVYYSPNPTIYNNICGSVYDVNGTYLVDFPVAAGNTQTILQGLGSSENVIFNLQYPANYFCNNGWNAYPIASNSFAFTSTFKIFATPATLPIAAGQSGQAAVSISQQEGFTGPVSLTATGFPAGVTYSFSSPSATTSSTLTIATASGTLPGTYPIVITGTSGSLVSSFTMNLVVVRQPLFTISASPAALTIAESQSGQVAVSITSPNGSTGAVSFTASGFPNGVTSSFSSATATAGTTLTIAVPAGTAPGTYPITIYGAYASVVNSVTLYLTVAVQTSVNLAAQSSIYAIFNNGSTVTNGGMDTSNYAYSANLLGTSLAFNGVSYAFGTPGSANAVSSTTLALPSASYTTLNFLAAAVFGNQPAQTFIVTYTDGTTSTFTQGISDWGSPQNYPGESIALTVPYRLTQSGAQQTYPFNLYAYSFPLNSAKTVKSLTLPNSRNVVLLSATLLSGITPVSLGSAANVYAIFNNGSTVTNGGMDTSNYAYSANLLGASLTFNGVSYAFGTPGTANAVSSATLPLTPGNYSALSFLGSAVYGNQPAQTFVVTYTDGTTSTFTQGLSDWGSPQNYPGESIASTMPYRLTQSGAQQTYPFNLYAYSFPLNSAKTVKSLTLPNSRNVVVLAVSLSASTGTSSQTIAFSAVPTQTIGTTLTLSATASSGLTVGFASSTTMVCTVSSGVATFLAAGTCTITASQAGNLIYAAAVPVSQSFTVQVANQMTPVSIASVANVYGIFNNGSTVTNGGLDTAYYAYSANLLGTSLAFNGVSYAFGTPGSANAVSSTTLALPSASYTTLNFLAAAVFGNQPAQTFIVTYTDGTTSTFTQGISDWGLPQNYPGESIASTMPYRLTQSGAQQTYPFNLYAYSFPLNSAKTVKSLTLPNSRNVVLLAVTLSGASR